MGTASTRLRLRTGLICFESSSVRDLLEKIEANSVVAIEPVTWDPSELGVSDMLSGLDLVLISSRLDPRELELWLETIKRKEPSIVILLAIDDVMQDDIISLVERYDCLPIGEADPEALPPSELGDILASALILRMLMETEDGIGSLGVGLYGLHC